MQRGKGKQQKPEYGHNSVRMMQGDLAEVIPLPKHHTMKSSRGRVSKAPHKMEVRGQVYLTERGPSYQGGRKASDNSAGSWTPTLCSSGMTSSYHQFQQRAWQCIRVRKRSVHQLFHFRTFYNAVSAAETTQYRMRWQDNYECWVGKDLKWGCFILFRGKKVKDKGKIVPVLSLAQYHAM